jgi:hypothetical protein
MRDRWWLQPAIAAELFAIVNLGFLAVDVWVAHSINAFAERAEWIPVIFSILAPLLLAGGALADRMAWLETDARTSGRWIGLIVGWLSLAVGVAGMIFHLESHFFEEKTLKSLVYTAPFIAPLAYSGIGLLLIMNRMVRSRTVEWARWIIVLAMGGFAGNFVLSLADHAQNAFFHVTEWIPVAASALALGFLLMLLVKPLDRLVWTSGVAVMLMQMLVGVAGLFFHVRANLAAPAQSLWERFLYGAPAFAPMLFPNLALLALIGMWELQRQRALNHAA